MGTLLSKWRWLVAAAWLLVAWQAPSQDFIDLFDDASNVSAEELLAALEGENAATDFALLKNSCRLELRYWDGVDGRFRRPADRDEEAPPPGWVWDTARGWLSPIQGREVPATTTIAIPEKGTYRIWLRRHTGSGVSAPVTLTLGGANTARHVFGSTPLTGDVIRKQEQKLHFRSEKMRDSVLLSAIWLWEYWDVELAAGHTTVAIASGSPAARISTLFVTQSRSFVPNQGAVREDNNLDKIYYRFRVRDGAQGADVYAVTRASVTFHWNFSPPGMDGKLLSYASLTDLGYGRPGPPISGEDGSPKVKLGEWTGWVDATYCSTGAGPWFTLGLIFDGIDEGVADVQLAWFPAEGAVLKTASPIVLNKNALLEAPALLGRIDFPVPEAANSVLWGTIQRSFTDRLRTATEVHAELIERGRQAIEELGLPADHPRPKKLRFYTSLRVVPQGAQGVVEMLASLGINESSGQSREAYQEAGIARSLMIACAAWGWTVETHDPRDPAIPDTVRRRFREGLEKALESDPHYAEDMRKILLGDEIGPVVGGTMINHSSDCRAHFHAYLRTVLTSLNETPAFFGVGDVEELDFLESLPEASTRFQRRLYYHCQIYKYYLTADFYRHTTQATGELYPRAFAYANFSPHPALLGDQTMNQTDWFNLTRMGGASMAWGEDWASGGRWGYNGREIVSFEGAWVESASRWGELASGFYLVGTMGGADHKMISLVNRGIDLIHLYDFGPLYAWAGAGNAWSDSPQTYREIARGSHVLGPADTIIAEGRQQPRKTALLYNRLHEIWNGGPYGMLCDRALTFAALGNGHYNADVILVDDLVPEILARYEVIYLNGFNLPAASIPHLHRWVEEGGTLVGTAATGTLDEYNEPLPATDRLFGATQAYVGSSRGPSWHPFDLKDHDPIATLTLRESALTPALTAPVIGSMAVLTPLDGESVGTYADGTCAAVIHALGKGRTLLYGFLPGILYKGDAPGPSTYRLERESLVTRPARATLGDPAVTINAPQVELALFEHESGLAVTLNNFACSRWSAERPPVTLTVATARRVSDVSSSLQGKLAWKRDGDRLLITMPLPHHVDTVVLRMENE